MPMTITEKILADHAGKACVTPGEIVEVKVDLALANDITAPLAIKVFREMGADRVFDPSKVALIQDHFVPNKDIESAEQARVMREFAGEQGVVHFYELGDSGIEHVLLPEKGLVLPGDLIIGADSHTCTYGALGAFSTGVGSTDLAGVLATGEIWLKVPSTIKVVYQGQLRKWVQGKDLVLYTIGVLGVEGARYRTLEFSGPAIQSLSMEGRLTMANMAVEAGAKNGIVPPDEITRAYVAERSRRLGVFYGSDPDAEYERVVTFHVEDIEPQVACPHSPDNTKPVSEVRDVRIDQAFVGSCTNGRIEDLRSAAQVLTGRKVHEGVRLIVIPGSRDVYRKALSEGLFDIFLDAGAVIGPPTCGPCLGGHMGVLASGEKAVSTSNRNFVGRMGHPKSEVYLANPAVAAASAVLGRVGLPDEI
ncbi:MAG: 3-isopropylmalate dehydratase large subunit [Deltaproteobacteria bacterium]|nr:3-isopropylmalate dehydratase large subunit [Deltaproteobacteria bacterium]